jgi:hypothetical protein
MEHMEEFFHATATSELFSLGSARLKDSDGCPTLYLPVLLFKPKNAGVRVGVPGTTGFQILSQSHVQNNTRGIKGSGRVGARIQDLNLSRERGARGRGREPQEDASNTNQ